MPSNSGKIIADLKKTISELENENQELISSLDLLDSEHQLNTEKLINLKDKLQEDYNELEDKYNELLKNQLKETKACNKCENLLKELETLKNEIAVLKSNNVTLQKVLDDCKNTNDEQLAQLKLCESENKILVMELKKVTQSITEFEKKSEIDKENFQKLSSILEGYEQQVSSLKEQKSELKRVKEQTHTKYVTILTENMKKYVDCDLNETSNSDNNNEDPQIVEFSHQVESILNILLDLKSKCDNLEKELFNVTQEKTNMLTEKNHEIEKLMQNSEILSQEVIRKSQTIKDYESECSELLKNNDMLINELEMYKNSSGLQTISESNEDNILLLESQLENANRKIDELEKIISDMEKKEEPSEEKLSFMFEKVKTDLENTEYQYNEMKVNMETLREEIDNYKKKNEELIERKLSLEKINMEYEDMRSEFNVIKEKLLLEEDTRKQLESQVRNLTEKLQNAKMSETSLKLQYDTVNKELISLRENYKHQEENEKLKKLEELEQKIEELNATKNELTDVILTKHQENITYHNEIQRLTQILTTTKLQTDEIEKLTDQNNFLRQKCEVLAENLLQEQSKVQKILAEPSEREQNLSKKLERLQSHLIEVEEHYTQELLRAEERNTELQGKVNEIEQREKKSSTMYTSVSIRANQHVETLQHQLQLITNQRDELRRKISDAEDHASKQEAALANLQFVLEQFQKEKENDIGKETERIRRQIMSEKRVQDELRSEIVSLQAQLEESKQGLLAASRISDQLEQSKHLIANLKSQVSQLKERLEKSEDEIKALSSQTDGKVDKSLIKNLVIGFVTTNNNLTKDQTQILKIIATVLDFSQQDHDKLNLNKPQQGWLSSLLTPQTSGMTQESLSQAFVKFLENESKPRLVPSLLSNTGETPVRKNSVPRQSPSVLSEVVLPTFADFAQNRNSSSILKDVLKDNS
ncbi:thyroid receptor-interacting protein 11 isoform X2 [Tribolium madens]|nr:thyroid receptor-interacting protein 11 isoform X2 [Tribolium madens]